MLKKISFYKLQLQLKDRLKDFTELFIKNPCILCKSDVTWSHFLCKQCHEYLPLLNKPHCEICCEPFTNIIDMQFPFSIKVSDICGRCQKKRPAYKKCIAPFEYFDPVITMLHYFKYKNKFSYANPLIETLLQRIEKEYSVQTLPKAIIPIPLHNSKIKTRGYNQSIIIGNKLGKRLKLPVYTNILKRIKNTQSQTSLDIEERHKNMKNAFVLNKIDPNLNLEHIAILDDTITTGATANAAAILFKKYKISCDVWCLAKTPLSK